MSTRRAPVKRAAPARRAYAPRRAPVRRAPPRRAPPRAAAPRRSRAPTQPAEAQGGDFYDTVGGLIGKGLAVGGRVLAKAVGLGDYEIKKNVFLPFLIMM